MRIRTVLAWAVTFGLIAGFLGCLLLAAVGGSQCRPEVPLLLRK